MDTLKKIISQARAIWAANKQSDDVEAHPGIARSDYAASDIRSSVFAGEPIVPSEKLVRFRLLVGIHQDRSFRAPHGFKPSQRPVNVVGSRPAPNMGLYTTVFANEVKAKRNFKYGSMLINSCLGLQIIFAAALTALGAADGSRGAVTVFGAFNTVIAGFLTFLKGSGMPNRLKYYQHEWGKVREYIEQRERELMLDDTGIDVLYEAELIRQMYESVKRDVENNIPERFVGNGGLQVPQRGLAMPQLSQPEMSKQFEGQFQNLHDRGQGFANNLRDNFKSFEAGGRAQLRDMVSDRSHGLMDRFKTFESGGRDQLHDLQEKGHDFIDHQNRAATEKTRGFLDRLESFESAGKDWFHAKETMANTAVNAARHVGDSLNQDFADLKSQLHSKMQEVERLEQELDHHATSAAAVATARGSVAFSEKKHDLEHLTEAAAREANHLSEELESRARGAVEQNRQAAHDLVDLHAQRTTDAAHELVDQVGGVGHSSSPGGGVVGGSGGGIGGGAGGSVAPGEKKE